MYGECLKNAGHFFWLVCLSDYTGWFRKRCTIFFSFLLLITSDWFIMFRRCFQILLRTKDFKPAHHNASETEEVWREWERQREYSCLHYYQCASSAKNAVPVAQAPCQHRMTEGTVHRKSLYSREGARETEVERANRYKVWQLWNRKK